jgi:cell wall-associated NlpC family hydrolase
VASSGYLRALVGAFSATAMAATACVLMSTPAYGEPPPPAPPPNAASDAAKQLEVAQHEAESLTEQWHAAQDNLQARQADADRAEAAVAPARQAAEQARQAEEKFRVQVDQVATQAMETGRLDQLNALVLSDSPSDYLDQMTTLETFTADQKAVLDKARALVAAAERAEADASNAVAAAQRDTEQARAALRDIDVRKKAADVRIAQAQRLLDQLSPAQRAARIIKDPPPVGITLGNGKGAQALRAAMTRMDMPYVWGATGPRSFDCSGLVYWAFKQVGITMPRSSSAQAMVGRPVSRTELQVGDLIFFYHPVSHVGFYAGNGKVLNAVQTGDVVRYSDLSRMQSYAGARRL